MNILIYGAGVLGSLYAARLHQAGCNVSILARGQRLADLREHGLVIVDAYTNQQTTVQVNIVASLAPGDAYDLVIVLVRKNQVASILPALAANQHTPNVLFMTNNAAGSEIYTTMLGHGRVLLGFPGAGGVRDGHIIRTTLVSKRVQATTLGELDGLISPRLTKIAAVFQQAGFPIAINHNIDAWLKTHVALVSPIANALYLAGGDNYRLARTRDGLILIVRAIREGLRVLQAHNIPITPSKLNIFARLPEPLLVALLFYSFNTEFAAIGLAGHANAARDEMQWLADEFRTLARATPIPTPAIDRLYAHLEPGAAPLPEGSAQIPLDWHGMGIGVGLLVGAGIGHRLKHESGMLAGALIGTALGWWLTTPRRMPLAAIWQQALTKRHGAIQAAQLIARVEARYDELYAGRSQPANPTLRWHLEHRILPGLALYHVLCAEYSNRDTALAEVDELFRTLLSWRQKQIALLHRLPKPFIVFRWLLRRIMQTTYPSEGWDIEWVADDPQRIAFDIRRCFYLDTLTAYGAPELTPHYCAADDWMFAALPPSISWERTKTLGRGDDRCDFCWLHVASDEKTALPGCTSW
ncbi:MAG: L-2-amino-thiazoline-4-carboxylic acid hydrolase [Chloroflexales bacterium]|nr:L-2-amino-thiazoline-4-carboxylic acid hydrolase [Chloroflexales bacterium]